MPARERMVDLPHLRLAARQWGEPSLPRVLALHGWLDNAASFDALATHLCTHFHIVALDLPGHGRSQHRPPGAWYHFVDYVDDVVAAADALGWERFSLLGHSLGAGVSSLIAAACPERVQRLLLIEMVGGVATPADQALTQLQRGLVQRRALGSKPLRLFDDVEDAVAVRRKAGGISDAAARTLVLRGIQAVEGGWTWTSDPRLMPAVMQRYDEEQTLAILRGVRAPSLLVLAEPMALPIAESTILHRAAQIPDLSLVRMPGNHHLHMETPDRVAREILRFMGVADVA